MKEQILNVSRRGFLKLVPAAAATLAVGLYVDSPLLASGEADPQFAPNVWVAIDRQGKVFIWCARVELGQGVRTSLPAIVAEELGADWKKIEVVPADYNPKYGAQSVGGSASIRTSWDMLRKAGATTREMLIEAYCRKTGAARPDCKAEDGFVIHSSGKRMPFGELVEIAATLSAPQNAPLKDKKDFKYIGKPLQRVDSLPKLTGEAKFTPDLRPVPGMLFASVVHCPTHGGSVKTIDGAAALKIPGVKHVVKAAADAVAVVADDTWAALRGREALKVTWEDGPSASESDDTLRAQFEKLTEAPRSLRNEGDVEAGLKTGTVLEAVYAVPFISHAPLETPDAIAWVQKDRCDVWIGAQDPEKHEAVVRQITGLPSSAIHFNIPYTGGGFGRRAFCPELAEAVEISKQIGAPVQVMWTRADDLQNDVYRPASYHRLSGALGADGLPVAWWHRYSSTPIMTSMDPQTEHPERLEVGGALDLPYAIPNLRVSFAPATSALKRGWLRSVANSFNAFVVESFLDELAVAAKRDPYEYRMTLLQNARKFRDLEPARLRGVLSLVAEKSGWGKRKLGPGRGMGIAAHYSFRSYVAEVAEVAVDSKGNLKVERITCAVDCGQVINPAGVRQQVEGGIAFALSAALKGRISVKSGVVEQGSWSDYDILRFSQMPEVDIHTVENDYPPTGLGEPAFPPVAPAVTNAIFAATGKRIRQLPIKL